MPSKEILLPKMTTKADLNDNEKKAIEELRERLEGDMEDEMYEDRNLFFMFLKAQDMDVIRAELHIRKHLRWREKYDVNNILSLGLPEVVEKYMPYIFLGYDKEGCVIRYLAIGNVDINGVLNCLNLKDCVKSMIYMAEEDTAKLKMQSKILGKNVNQCIYICDLDNLTFRKATNKKAVIGALIILKNYQSNYPGRIKSIYVINGSIFLAIIYNYLKMIFGSSTMSRIHLYYDESWKNDLLKDIDADVLPAFLGGNRTDPDGNPLCLTFVNRGEVVPEHYYLSTSKKSLAGVKGVKKITLSRAEFHEEILEVNEAGSSLEWEFETECRDIGFGVFYEEDLEGEKKMIELIPHQRIETEECSETGMLVCERTGKYVFLFDNTYSLIRSKEVFYKISVIPPKEIKPSYLQEIHCK